MQTFKEEDNQSIGKGTDKALNEQTTSVILDTDFQRSRGIDSLLGSDNTEVDTDGENEDSDSDSDIY